MSVEATPTHAFAEDARTAAVRTAIHSFMHTNRMHRAAIERKLADLGIHRTQHMMLLDIKKNGGIGTQRALAERFDISPAAVAVTLKKLEEGGYIARRAGAHDSRCKEVRLTERGEEILRSSYEAFTAVDLAMFADFTEDELAAFGAMLARLQSALRAADTEGVGA